MTDNTTSASSATVTLPSYAPKIRITAGMGTASQKTWNLRRPVTMIGASRLAHIVLAKDTVSRAHCIIVNTGKEVLLKDLYSSNGTRCNSRRVDLAVLNDGDVLQLGDTTIQVAVQATGRRPDESDAGMIYHDPLMLPEPLTLQNPNSFDRWTAERAVTIIGCRAGVSIQLDHPDVSRVHAALLYIGSRLAVFDLTSGTGTWVNQRREPLAALDPGDHLKIGPFEMVVGGAPPRELLEDDSADLAVAPAKDQDAGLSKLAEVLQARAEDLDRREQRLADERAELDTARQRIENDRRALEQQAMALWKANAELELERKAYSRRGPDLSLAPGLSARSAEGRSVSRQTWWNSARPD